ncbi:AMP-binding protein [Temperatibacter marinus]|uniref:AMP-binding protein n=1 Tax=Temperatibacter marinus TaxID=1456591 RepID=A0AA52EDN9_9PROT|nr:AMP-binding protein [Temperatibacter marinus]WND03557.1 AMP-binding protein [Temperatibacter marinus]
MNQTTTLYELFRNQASQQGDKIAMTYHKAAYLGAFPNEISYQVYFKVINQTMNLFKSVTEKKKPVVATLLPLLPQSQFIMWGAASSGIILPLNPLLSVEALSGLLAHSKADIVCVFASSEEDPMYEKIAALKAEHPELVFLSVGKELTSLDGHYDKLVSECVDTELTAEERPAPSDICAYFHTGGTTGLPKIAQQTHASNIALINMYHDRLPNLDQKTTMNGLPLFHVGGATLNNLCAYGVGGHVITPHPLGYRDPETIQNLWHIIDHYKINTLVAIPTSLGSLCQVDVGDADISSLEYFLTGGAVVPEAVSSALYDKTGVAVYEIYGMTETCGGLAIADVTKAPIPRSAGKPLAGSKIRIGEGTEPVGSIGEIFFKGPNLFKGYLGKEDQSFEEDGWLRTGDLGCYDEEGHIYLKGRAKDLIIRSGHNIDPVLIEACLEKHPSVAMAAAVGIPDHYAGELPIAYIEIADEAEADLESIKAFARQTIPDRPALPKEIIILEELPKTAVGKIYKPELRRMATMTMIEKHFTQKRLIEYVLLKSSLTKAGLIDLAVIVYDPEKLEVCQSLSRELCDLYKLEIDVQQQS